MPLIIVTDMTRGAALNEHAQSVAMASMMAIAMAAGSSAPTGEWGKNNCTWPWPRPPDNWEKTIVLGHGRSPCMLVFHTCRSETTFLDSD